MFSFMQDQVTIRLYGPIDEFTSIADEIRLAISNNAKEIQINLDTPGGGVFAGFAIISAIQEAQEKGIKVKVFIESLAASMGAFIAVMADYTEMNEYAQLMIHSAGALVRTDDELELLKSMNKSLKAILKARTGKDMRTLNKWLKADTWFSAEEALAEGLVDKIKKVSKKVENSLDLSRVDRIKQIYNKEKYETELLYADIAAVYDETVQLKTNTASMLKQIQAIFEDATEENYIDKISAVIKVKADLEKTLKEIEAKLEGEKVNSETLNARIVDLETSVESYRQAEIAAQEAKADALIDTAVEANKIKVSTKDKWLEFANSNYENTKEILEGIVSQPLKLHQIAENPSNGEVKTQTAHDAYVASLDKKNSKF